MTDLQVRTTRRGRSVDVVVHGKDFPHVAAWSLQVTHDDMDWRDLTGVISTVINAYTDCSAKGRRFRYRAVFYERDYVTPHLIAHSDWLEKP